MSDNYGQVDLTVLLGRATSDPSYREAFLRAMLTNSVYFLATVREIERPTFNAGGQSFHFEDPRNALDFVELENEGIHSVPFWTALSELENDLHRFDMGEQPYMVMSGLDFLRHSRGRDIVLNPGTYGRQFSPRQCEVLIKRGETDEAIRRRAIERESAARSAGDGSTGRGSRQPQGSQPQRSQSQGNNSQNGRHDNFQGQNYQSRDQDSSYGDQGQGRGVQGHSQQGRGVSPDPGRQDENRQDENQNYQNYQGDHGRPDYPANSAFLSEPARDNYQDPYLGNQSSEPTPQGNSGVDESLTNGPTGQSGPPDMNHGFQSRPGQQDSREMPIGAASDYDSGFDNFEDQFRAFLNDESNGPSSSYDEGQAGQPGQFGHFVGDEQPFPMNPSNGQQHWGQANDQTQFNSQVDPQDNKPGGYQPQPGNPQAGQPGSQRVNQPLNQQPTQQPDQAQFDSQLGNSLDDLASTGQSQGDYQLGDSQDRYASTGQQESDNQQQAAQQQAAQQQAAQQQAAQQQAAQQQAAQQQAAQQQGNQPATQPLSAQSQSVQSQFDNPTPGNPMPGNTHGEPQASVPGVPGEPSEPQSDLQSHPAQPDQPHQRQNPAQPAPDEQNNNQSATEVGKFDGTVAVNPFLFVDDAVDVMKELVAGRSDAAWRLLSEKTDPRDAAGVIHALGLLYFTSLDSFTHGSIDASLRSLTESAEYWADWTQWAREQKEISLPTHEELHQSTSEFCVCSHEASQHGRYAWALREVGIQTEAGCDVETCQCQNFKAQPAN